MTELPISNASVGLPNYFGHMMAPEAHKMDILPPPHLPYDVLDFMQTTDLVLDDIETLEFDFDAGFPSFFEGLETAETRQQTEQDDGSEIAQDAEGTASRREAFERSPWYVYTKANFTIRL